MDCSAQQSEICWQWLCISWERIHLPQYQSQPPRLNYTAPNAASPCALSAESTILKEGLHSDQRSHRSTTRPPAQKSDSASTLYYGPNPIFPLSSALKMTKNRLANCQRATPCPKSIKIYVKDLPISEKPG